MVKKRKKTNSKRRKLFLFRVIILLTVIGSSFFFYQEIKYTKEVIPKPKESTPSKISEKESLLVAGKRVRGDFSLKEQAGAPLLNMTGLHSTNMILIDRESEKVLADKKSREKIFPASLTKIMTVLLGIEQLGDLNQKVPMKEEYFEGLLEMDASMAGFQTDEIVSYRDILYGAILPSGAESCLAIAQLVSGSEEQFVEQMNERAKQLGLRDTHFSNTTGLHDAKNYSTVEDIARLLEYALQNEEFSHIFKTKQFTTSPTNKSPEGVEMKSSLFRYIEGFPQLELLLQGGKTGFTEEAGLCLASVAEINGKQYLLVTAGAPSDAPEESLHIQDAALVYLQLTKR